ncbi:MAG TPA: hypothetical protein VFC78_14050 [Tepidisphaeraceae bacterium]|nr:hypothetical protein [Tepidisphaeraceae bacterium]
MRITRSCVHGLMAVLVSVALSAGFLRAGDDPSTLQIRSGDTQQIREAIASIRAELQSDPGHAVDRLNESWTVALLQAKQYAAVEEFAIAGTISLPADTWRIEQLQRHRVEALLAEGKPREALSAARGLFNVCGMGFTKDALPILCDCLKAAHPEDPGIVPRFKVQMLANAQEGPKDRARLLAKCGGNSIMESIPADPLPYAKAIASRAGLTEYRELYGTGNLLLMAGRLKEAHAVFDKVYAIAPKGELKYATEGIAKVIKAEDGGLGKANQFVISIRPAP